MQLKAMQKAAPALSLNAQTSFRVPFKDKGVFKLESSFFSIGVYVILKDF